MINIVYDVDGVLNNLNEYIFDLLGLPTPKLYDIKKCREYTLEQQQEIISYYKDPNVFKNLSLVPGASDICSIEDTGLASVWINSGSFSTAISDIKTRTILDGINNICVDRIRMQLIKSSEDKDIIDFTDIIVEDCFENLMKYSDKTVKILIDKTYNRCENIGTCDKRHGVLRVPNLIVANNLIRELVINHTDRFIK